MTKLEKFYLRDTPKKHLEFLKRLDERMEQNEQINQQKDMEFCAKIPGGAGLC